MYKLMKSFSKSEFLLFVIFVLSTSIILVPVSFASIGVKEDDWAKYEVTSTTIEGSEELLKNLGDIDLEWFRIDIKNITGDNIMLEITTHYLDGTEELDTVDAREVGFIVEADLKEGDSIIAPLIVVEAASIKGTISREYAGVSRTVNYIDLSATEVVTLTYRAYFDKTTGVLCEISLSLSMDVEEQHHEAIVIYKLTETNVFKSTLLIEQWWFYLLIGIVVIVIVIVVIVIRRR